MEAILAKWREKSNGFETRLQETVLLLWVGLVTVNLVLNYLFLTTFSCRATSLMVSLSNYAEANHSVHPTRGDCGAPGPVRASVHVQRAHHEEQGWADGADLWLHRTGIPCCK